MDFGHLLLPMLLLAAYVALFFMMHFTPKEHVLRRKVFAVAAIVCILVFLPLTYNAFIVTITERLFVCAQKGDAWGVERALQFGADPEAESESGETALHAAQQGGHKDVVKLLKDAGARR